MNMYSQKDIKKKHDTLSFIPIILNFTNFFDIQEFTYIQ